VQLVVERVGIATGERARRANAEPDEIGGDRGPAVRQGLQTRHVHATQLAFHGLHQPFPPRIKPTATPSIAKPFRGSTAIGAKSGFSATSSTSRPRRFSRLTVTSSPSRATTTCPQRASLVLCTRRR